MRAQFFVLFASASSARAFSCDGVSDTRQLARCTSFANLVATLGEENWASCTNGTQEPCTLNDLSAQPQANCEINYSELTTVTTAIVEVYCTSDDTGWIGFDTISFQSPLENGMKVQDQSLFRIALESLLLTPDAMDPNMPVILDFGYDSGLFTTLETTCVPECNDHCRFPFESVVNEIPQLEWANFTLELVGENSIFNTGFDLCERYIPSTETPTLSPSSEPTKSPTPQLTTLNPTHQPTTSPVPSPTKKPTTDDSTESPVSSFSPTKTPTSRFTRTPTSRPSRGPTKAKSPSPSPTAQISIPPSYFWEHNLTAWLNSSPTTPRGGTFITLVVLCVSFVCSL